MSDACIAWRERKNFSIFLIFFLPTDLDPSALKELDDYLCGRRGVLRDDCAPSSRRACKLKCIRSVRRSRVNSVRDAKTKRPHPRDFHDGVKAQMNSTRESYRRGLQGGGSGVMDHPVRRYWGSESPRNGSYIPTPVNKSTS